MSIHKTSALMAVTIALANLLSMPACAEPPAGEPKQSATPTDQILAAEGFAKLHQLILPQDGELKWAALPWLTSITLARHQAAVDNKPLCIFADTGAGFADALGLC